MPETEHGTTTGEVRGHAAPENYEKMSEMEKREKESLM